MLPSLKSNLKAANRTLGSRCIHYGKAELLTTRKKGRNQNKAKALPDDQQSKTQNLEKALPKEQVSIGIQEQPYRTFLSINSPRYSQLFL